MKAVVKVRTNAYFNRLLGTADGCDALVRRVPMVDILVNNLGIFELKPFEQIPD
jgi:NAD(P)-dependent dehydrogenase (short-subunit alcohol dehydrogenase family)